MATASNSAGKSVVASNSFTLDTLAPTVSVTTFSVAENTPPATSVGTLAANEAVTWAVGSGNDSGLFNVSSAGVITFKASPNFEMPRGLALSAANGNAYTLNVVATDKAGNVTNRAITVNVTDVNEAPALVGTVPAQTAVINQPFSRDITAYFSDPDTTAPNNALTYSATGLPAGFSINATTGVITGTTASTLSSPVNVTVTARDGGGLSATQTFSFNVVAAPVVQSFTVTDGTASNGANLGKAGEALTFTLTMSEAVTIAGGTPSITFGIGGTTVTVDYVSGSGTSTLIFAKSGVVTPSGNSTSVTLNTIALNSATVTGQTSMQTWQTSVTGQTAAYTLDNTPPATPILTLGAGVSNGATNAEATQASGVVLVNAENGSTVQVKFF